MAHPTGSPARLVEMDSTRVSPELFESSYAPSGRSRRKECRPSGIGAVQVNGVLPARMREEVPVSGRFKDMRASGFGYSKFRGSR